MSKSLLESNGILITGGTGSFRARIRPRNLDESDEYQANRCL